ncbi:hypothetical protein DPMN_050157 [Dreissena polymorpha]|uniref:RING-type domain-containing protein n=1 Tax=Dreissena polymorpha TaxID=45954 RepID=A0A9D4CHG0_DREPO|nr:hypothetical protein DPMN_050157 [Dreissena polymorpha]
MVLLLLVTYILEASMARTVPPRNTLWMLYLCFFMDCLLILAHLGSSGMNCLSQAHAGFMHTGVRGTFKWCYYRNHFGHAYVGFGNGQFKIRTSISLTLLHTNRASTRTDRNDGGGGLHRTDGRRYQQTIDNALQDNEVMRHRIVCTICNTRDRRVVFIPCGHFLTCELCGQETDTCPACRLDVNSRVVVNQ